MLLINTDKMDLLKCSNDSDAFVRLEHFAEKLCPVNNFYICENDYKSFSVFTLLELNLLYVALGGQHTNLDYGKIISNIVSLIDNLDMDNCDISNLKLKSPSNKIPEHDSDNTPSVKVKILPKSNTSVRPKSGSTTGKVWDIADEMQKGDSGLGYDSKEFRNCVIDQCIKEGINKATAATQFSKWKKGF